MSSNSTNVTSDHELLTVVKLMNDLTIVGMIIIGTFLILEWINFYQQGKAVLKRRTLILLHGVTVFGFLISVGCFAMFQGTWQGLHEECTIYVRVVTISLWCFMKMFIYGLLYERMAIVHHALGLNYTLIWGFRWIMFLIIVAGIPAMFFPITVYFFRGHVSEPDGICIQYSISPAVLYFVVVTDFLVNCVLLGLFIIPLSNHANEFSKTGKDVNPTHLKTLKRVAIKNLAVSSVLICVLIACLIYMALDSVANTDGEIGARQLSGLVAGYIDPTIETILCHVITFSWIPKFRKKKSRIQDKPPSPVKSPQRHLLAVSDSTGPKLLSGESSDHGKPNQDNNRLSFKAEESKT